VVAQFGDRTDYYSSARHKRTAQCILSGSWIVPAKTLLALFFKMSSLHTTTSQLSDINLEELNWGYTLLRDKAITLVIAGMAFATTVILQPPIREGFIRDDA